MKTFERPIETYFGPLSERLDAMSLSFTKISEQEHERFVSTLRSGAFTVEKSFALETLNDLLAQIEALEKTKPKMPQPKHPKSIYERTLNDIPTKVGAEQIRKSYENGHVYRAYINELTFYKEELNRLIGRISRVAKKAKIRTRCTATELACKLKIEKLTKMVDDEGNGKELCRKIIRSYSSKKAININEKGFYDAYVTPSLKDLLAVKRFYEDGLDKINDLIQRENAKLGGIKKK
jgi:hypothetical protein